MDLQVDGLGVHGRAVLGLRDRPHTPGHFVLILKRLVLTALCARAPFFLFTAISNCGFGVCREEDFGGTSKVEMKLWWMMKRKRMWMSGEVRTW